MTSPPTTRRSRFIARWVHIPNGTRRTCQRAPLWAEGKPAAANPCLARGPNRLSRRRQCLWEAHVRRNRYHAPSPSHAAPAAWRGQAAGADSGRESSTSRGP
jgi:hypothetical protein